MAQIIKRSWSTYYFHKIVFRTVVNLHLFILQQTEMIKVKINT